MGAAVEHLDTHPLAAGVHMGFEGRHDRVFGQGVVVVEPRRLPGRDVDAVLRVADESEPERLVLRFVVLGIEPQADVEAHRHLDADRVRVKAQLQVRAGLDQPPYGLGILERVLPELVDDQVVSTLGPRRVRVAGDVGDARVMDDPRAQFRALTEALGRLFAKPRWPDLLDLDRLQVAVFGQTGRKRTQRAPPV